MAGRPNAPTFLWHDYETWGSDPRRDRPCQFAAVRTDVDLNEIGDPSMFFCRPSTDLLPHPEACLITGITPRLAERTGLIEAEFAAAVNAELSVPGTCGVGYNSMRFDDEVTRNLLYRNLLDPYAREWRNGNSRWDLIDALRLAHALRPEGLVWPTREDGTTSFKLEHLTADNEIDHGQAHDALADVRATIALARRLRHAQPKLFDYVLTLRDKRRVRELLDRGVPLLHASARYPAAQGCIAPILPLCAHPLNGNGVICVDLRAPPELLIELSAEEIRTRLFTPASSLPEGVERVPLKTIHVNRAPVLAPMKTLEPGAAARWSIDPGTVADHARRLREAAAAIEEKVRAAHCAPDGPTETDPDLMIYSGGFFSDADRRAMDAIQGLDPAELSDHAPSFQDPRLGEMLLRYRARNWPETLTPEEREDWDLFRLARLTDPAAGGSIVIDQFEQCLSALAEQYAGDSVKLAILEDLAEWAERVLDAEA
ncbi:exodeoxyribonuclease I [Thiocapsa bogorovii]|uniref:exodeoxyribonuclease I n=1 Tax=Thiocapsa bogorovii TaxID=521689 RepID=UPI001E60139A|nr:exodeoxyribonuclease I [Thiocapsa bogorovii]UHD17236.1 exodeoxyribonuclease I [Thiocapsa bogorovii]